MEMIKLAADDIFDGRRFLGPNRVLVLDASGAVSAVVPRSWAGDDIRQVEGWLCPGFINAHCHLELSHLKGNIPEHTGLPAFLTTVMEQRQPPRPEILQQAIEEAGQAMQAEGIVAVGDICNTAATLPYKVKSPVYWHSFIECMGFVDATAPQRLEHSATVYAQFRAQNQPASLTPHAPYSVSATLFRLIAGMDNNTPLTIHNQECAAEDELYRQKTGPFLDFYRHFGIQVDRFEATGKSSLQSWLPYLKDAPRLLLVHNTFTTEEDIRFAATPGVYWCFCPNANAYIENRLPDIPAFLRNGVKPALGTDSLASNHQLSIWAEIQTIRRNHPDIPLEDVLQWATLNGAEALGLSGTLGSFEKGKRPGIVQVRDNNAKAYTIYE